MIYVHGGQFHADDVMTTAIVQMATGEEEVSRVFKVPALKDGDIVLDVGRIYDPEKLMFDHHQVGGSDDGFAATGKVWQYYSEKILSCRCGVKNKVDIISNNVYKKLLGTIDRHDNGIKDCEKIREDWNLVSISGFISFLNPSENNEELRNEIFHLAVKMCSIALNNVIEREIKIVQMDEELESSEKIGDHILILKDGSPWQEAMLQNPKFGNILYVIFPSNRGGYNLQAVPDKIGGFGQRKPLPAKWAGLSGKDLTQLEPFLNLTPSVNLFCHPNRFIAGAETLEEVKKMARISVLY